MVVNSFFASFALLFEVPHRRLEITLFTVPRFLSGLWAYLKKKHLVVSLPYGEVSKRSEAGTAVCVLNGDPNVLLPVRGEEDKALLSLDIQEVLGKELSDALIADYTIFIHSQVLNALG